MNLATLVLVLLAQVHHRSGHEPRIEPELTVEPVVDPVRASDVNRVPAAPIVVMAPAPSPTFYDRMPWGWFFLGVFGVLVGLVIRRERSVRMEMSLPTRISLPSMEVSIGTGKHSEVCADSVRWAYDLVVGAPDEKRAADGEALPVPLEVRSLAKCQTEYVDTIRAVVKAQMGGRTDIRCSAFDSAPVASRWRAWIGAQSWETAHDELRSTGSTEGMALKRLLAAYKNNGGTWLAWAAERPRVDLPEVVRA